MDTFDYIIALLNHRSTVTRHPEIDLNLYKSSMRRTGLCLLEGYLAGTEDDENDNEAEMREQAVQGEIDCGWGSVRCIEGRVAAIHFMDSWCRRHPNAQITQCKSYSADIILENEPFSQCRCLRPKKMNEVIGDIISIVHENFSIIHEGKDTRTQ